LDSCHLKPEGLCLHLPGLLHGCLPGELPGASQVDVAHFSALSPGGRPVGIGLDALLGSLDPVRHPNSEILEPGLEFLAVVDGMSDVTSSPPSEGGLSSVSAPGEMKLNLNRR